MSSATGESHCQQLPIGRYRWGECRTAHGCRPPLLLAPLPADPAPRPGCRLPGIAGAGVGRFPHKRPA
ncbi:MAG: hypothetical protein ACKO45_15410, partial [Cyanobium sp.]